MRKFCRIREFLDSNYSWLFESAKDLGWEFYADDEWIYVKENH